MNNRDPFSVYTQSDDIKDRSVPDYAQSRYLGDEYRPDDADRESLRLHIPVRRLNIFLYVFCIVLVALFIRGGYLQIVRGGDYRALAEGNRIRLLRVKPARGIVYDRNERPLVENVPNFTLAAIPADLPKNPSDRDQLISTVARILELDPASLTQPLREYEDRQAAHPDTNRAYEPLTLAEQIDITHAISLKVQSNELPGITIDASTNRHYLGGPALSGLLGYVGKLTEDELTSYDPLGYARDDTVGKAGVEKSYESELRGQPGRTHVEVDSLGKVKKVVATDAAVPGRDVMLSINADFQTKLQRLLDDEVAALHTTGGAAVVMDPRNGEILALVSSPTYDNNLFSGIVSPDAYAALIGDPHQPLFQRATSGEYPSGSTIKPMIAAAALAEGIVTPATQVMSTGGIRIDQWFFPDWKSGGHGATNVIKALAESVNTYFYAIGGGYENIHGLGVEKIKAYGQKFGFGAPLGIDLPAEAAGFLPDKNWKETVKNEPWYIGDTYHLAIGQGDLLVTPLQIASMTSVFANHGTLYRPHVVRELRDSETKQPVASPAKPAQTQIVPPSAIEPVRQGMREAVVSGSAVALSTLPVPAAGKTGTAQFRTDQTHAWFTGFAPYDTPEIAITVLVEGGGEGHAAALPVAKEFLQWYFGGQSPNGD